jgi:hypothetical protein
MLQGHGLKRSVVQQRSEQSREQEGSGGWESGQKNPIPEPEIPRSKPEIPDTRNFGSYFG